MEERSSGALKRIDLDIYEVIKCTQGGSEPYHKPADKNIRWDIGSNVTVIMSIGKEADAHDDGDTICSAELRLSRIRYA